MRVLSFLLGLSMVSSAQALDTSFSYLLDGRVFDYDETAWASSAKPLIEQPDSGHTAVLELNLASESFSLTTAAIDTDEDDELSVREFYYRGDLQESEWLVGRRITPFGVGYAFRPLDVIQHEDLLAHDLQTDIGVNQLAWERFAGLGSFGAYLVHPENDNNALTVEQPALVLRYAESGERGDWQAVGRFSDANRVQLGAGGVWLPNDSLALHGSFLWSQRMVRQRHVLAARDDTLLSQSDPWRENSEGSAVSAVLGLNWTWSTSSNVIAEIRHDAEAPDRDEWNDLFDLMAAQHELLGTQVPQDAVVGNLAWTARAWEGPHSVRNNLLLRYQWQGDVLSLETSLLYSPSDHGRMLQAVLTRDFGGFKAWFGARGFDGPVRSVYGQIARQGELFLSLYGDF